MSTEWDPDRLIVLNNATLPPKIRRGQERNHHGMINIKSAGCGNVNQGFTGCS